MPYTLRIKSENTIYQTEVRCRVNENDFNYTQNPTAIEPGTDGSVANNITGSDFRPYATTIGLYNQKNELIVVGKFANPIPIPRNTDIVFVVRWDS
jgi:hypothetical protein